MAWINFIDIYLQAVEIIVSLTAIVLALYIFFSDPLRRWRFFGYRPTVIAILFDTKLKRVLLVCHREWAFPQGGIYSDDFYTTVEQTLTRELGISPNQYALRNVKPVGIAQGLGRHWGSNRASLNTFSIRKNLIGKGYLACFVEADLQKLLPKVQLGYDFQEVGLFTPTQAEKMINTDSLSPAKRRVHHRCLVEVQKLLAPTTRVLTKNLKSL